MTTRLRDRDIPFAVIGAAAIAVHGVPRSTRDLDLLVLAPDCLEPGTWDPLRAAGIEVRVERGDAPDPLAGVVRFSRGDERPVDVVVGKQRWQETVLTGAREAEIEGIVVPVASVPGLIALKLYAGGPLDAWDVTQLLEGPDRQAIVAEVQRLLPQLPAESQRLWRRIVEPAGA